jgi:MFS family permease
MQLFFALTWVVYVIYLPRLAAQAGIGSGAVLWILFGDQVIFALCDWVTGLASDRVAETVGRLGKLVAAVTALSALAFLLLPLVTRLGAPVFLGLTVVWTATSSALRAPPMKLLGRYTPPGQRPWVASLFLLGTGVASSVAPVLAGPIGRHDPRMVFAVSSLSVVAVTASMAWAEKRLARSAAPEKPAASGIRSTGFLVFLAAVALLALGNQVHTFLNTGPAFRKLAPAADLPGLLTLSGIGFSLGMLPASWLTKRFGAVTVMAAAALVAAVSAGAAELAPDVASLAVAQFVCGAAWGTVVMSAFTAALAIGHTGSEGLAIGSLFSLMAVAGMARILLGVGGFQHAALPWLPAVVWLAAGLMLLPARSRSARFALDVAG